MQTAHFSIPRLPESLNKMLTSHWTKRRSDKEEWVLEIKSIWNSLKQPRISSPVKIIITYYFPDNRIRDFDNYSGKYILDGLKNTFIDDDNARDCVKELVLKMEFKSPEPRTDIQILSL